MPAHVRVVVLRPLVTSPNIALGEYTCNGDPDSLTDFEHRNVLHAHGPELLTIGKYCAIASRSSFLMAEAERRRGASTYPLTAFGDRRAERTLDIVTAMPSRNDSRPASSRGSATPAGCLRGR
ncbi:hypothetical protein ABZZ37_18440 [Streptomyces sp. NPDC006464]|uniref:hypothetical protein n=1 Tax=Streptomyces sp. NPDC006464 TaxID=3154305 RepID=UPI0033BF843C